MEPLRRSVTALGFRGVRTYLQSGNFLFEGPDLPTHEVERRLERSTDRALGVRTAFRVRTKAELAQTVSNNPFLEAARTDPGHLVVYFLEHAPTAASVQRLRETIRGPEEVEAIGREAFVTYPSGIGRSRVTLGLVEGKLSTSGTGRNWNTVRALLRGTERPT